MTKEIDLRDQDPMRFFATEHLPEHLALTAQWCRELAQRVVTTLPDNAETRAGLRKLLEAKDCFVRALLD